MTIPDLISALQQRGVVVRAHNDGGGLHFAGSPEALTPAVFEVLHHHREEILAHLRASAVLPDGAVVAEHVDAALRGGRPL